MVTPREHLLSLGRTLRPGEAKEIARQFGVSKQRVSQIARQLDISCRSHWSRPKAAYCETCGKAVGFGKKRCWACFRASRPTAERITRPCSACGKPVTRPSYLVDRPRHGHPEEKPKYAFYCNRACFYVRREDIILTCPSCQKTFIARFKEGRKYCSRRCSGVAQSLAHRERHDNLS